MLSNRLHLFTQSFVQTSSLSSAGYTHIFGYDNSKAMTWAYPLQDYPESSLSGLQDKFLLKMTEFIHACLQVPCQRHLSLLETSGIRLWRSRGLGCCIPEFEHLEKQTRLLPMLKEKLLCEFSSYLCFTPVTNKTACMFWTALSGHTWSSELLTTSNSSKEKRGRGRGTEIWQRKKFKEY